MTSSSARLPFKPPRPQSAISQPAASISTGLDNLSSKTQSRSNADQKAARTAASLSADMEDDEPSRESNDAGEEPAIPHNLLVRILHEHFKHPDTRISKDAMSGITKYIEIFVREALARADWERSKTGGDDGGFLEVSLKLIQSSKTLSTSWC